MPYAAASLIQLCAQAGCVCQHTWTCTRGTCAPCWLHRLLQLCARRGWARQQDHAGARGMHAPCRVRQHGAQVLIPATSASHAGLSPPGLGSGMHLWARDVPRNDGRVGLHGGDARGLDQQLGHICGVVHPCGHHTASQAASAAARSTLQRVTTRAMKGAAQHARDPSQPAGT